MALANKFTQAKMARKGPPCSQDNVDVTADGELSDEALSGVSGGAVIGTPIAATDPPDPTL
jgi:hypothetical protein